MRQGRHVLIVEDSMDIQDCLKQLFHSEQYIVAQAFNGQEALDYLRGANELPECILLDIMMPVRDGYFFLREQKKDGRLAAIPIVIMSADFHIAGKAGELGANAFIKKPILDVDILLNAISLACG